MRIRTFVAVTFALGALCAPAFADDAKPDDKPEPTVTAEQREEARVRFQRGIDLYGEGEYKLALIEFERAYALSPSFRMLYNIGQVRQQLGHYARALTTLERYLAEGGDKVPAQRREDVARDIAQLKTRTARLLVRCSVAGAEIAFDGAPLAKCPMAAAELVDAGEHRIVVTKRGFLPESRAVTLAGGDDTSLDFKLTAEPVVSPHVVRVEERRAVTPTPNRTPMWIAWGGTVVLAGTASVFGLLSLGARSDLDNLKRTVGSSDADRQSALDRARTMGLIGDIVGVTAVAAGGVALYLTLKKPSESRGVAASVAPDAGGGRVLVSGAF